MWLYVGSMQHTCLIIICFFYYFLITRIIIIYLTVNGLSPGGSDYNACT
jgi:hypothetical protein